MANAHNAANVKLGPGWWRDLLDSGTFIVGCLVVTAVGVVALELADWRRRATRMPAAWPAS